MERYLEREQIQNQETIKKSIHQAISAITDKVDGKVVVINQLTININMAQCGGATIRVNSPRGDK